MPDKDCIQGGTIQGNIDVVSERLKNYIDFTKGAMRRIEHSIEVCTKETNTGLEDLKVGMHRSLQEIKNSNKEKSKMSWAVLVAIISGITTVLSTGTIMLISKILSRGN